MEDSLQRIEIERLAWAGPVTPAPQFAPLGWVAQHSAQSAARQPDRIRKFRRVMHIAAWAVRVASDRTKAAVAQLHDELLGVAFVGSVGAHGASES
jgi:hypothetical protein